MANAEHVSMIGRGTEFWNSWRRDHPDVLPDLRVAHLRGAAMQGMDLSGAILPIAILHSADLTDANLRGADLSSANLEKVILRGADLHGADLRGAKFTGGDLRGADLSDVDLRSGVLYNADIENVNLSGADQHARIQRREPDDRTAVQRQIVVADRAERMDEPSCRKTLPPPSAATCVQLTVAPVTWQRCDLSKTKATLFDLAPHRWR